MCNFSILLKFSFGMCPNLIYGCRKVISAQVAELYILTYASRAVTTVFVFIISLIFFEQFGLCSNRCDVTIPECDT